MRFGVHLPQYGRAAGPDAITRAARQAEELGFADVWAYDHVAIPADVSYPKAFAFEPIITLTWAAAATDGIGIGTSALVLPYRHPLATAKMLGSLDVLSGGRLVVGVGAGWLEGEFDALGVPYAERGARTDETIDVFRACWEGEQPVSFHGDTVSFDDMKIVPAPGRHIPIWVGGHSEPALRRAVAKGDGWHGAFLEVEQARPVLERLRQARPEPGYTLSVRLERDGLAVPGDELRREVEAWRDAGLQHLMAAPAQSTLDGWLRSVEALGTVFGEFADSGP